MKKICKSYKYIITYICMVIIFFSILYITALIPKELIFKKISESAEILNEEGGSYYYHINGRDIQIDNYTDAIMLNNVYSVDNNNIVESIIKCRRNYNYGITTRILGEKSGNLFNEDPVQELLDTINKENITSHEYARYWHGYMGILRPMLIFFNITQIRIIFEIILLISLAILAFYIYKKENKILSILMIFTFLAMDIFEFIKNIHGVIVIIIAIITSIFIANKKINEKNIKFILFIIGGLTAYLDFLSTPLITVLFPITIYFIINKKENLEVAFKETVLMCFFWWIGYFGIWISKWIINDCIYNSNLIMLSLNQIFFRINSKELVGNTNVPIRALIRNINCATNWITIGILIISVLNFYKELICKNLKGCLKKYKIIYIIITIAPILWYLGISNHSCQHFFFTYKLLIVTLFGIVCICFDNKKET